MNTKSLQETIRKPSPYLRRRIDMLDYEVEKNLNAIPFVGTTLCSFFKSDIEYFESIMENSIDAMYYNYFSHMDDNSGKWAHEYLDMVNYIRNKYQDKIMKHYNDNCGSGSIPLKESIRKVLKEELNESTYLRRRVDMSSLDKKFFTNLNIVTDKYLKRHVGYCSFNVFRTTVISYLIDDYRDNLSDEDYDNFPYDEVYNFLFNLFYDKIKDRYVEVFGGDINESENIKKVLSEELKDSLTDLIKTDGIERALKTVGGFKRLAKILELDLDDIDTQEMLVKNFIYHTKIDQIDVLFIEVRSSGSGGKIITVNLKTDDTASNVTSWYVHEICNYFNGRQDSPEVNKKLFPFKVKPAWHPVFGKDGCKIFLDANIVDDEEDEDLMESKQKGPREENKLPYFLRKRSLREESTIQIKLKNMINKFGIKMASTAVGGMSRLIKILDLDDKGLDELIYEHLKEELYPDFTNPWGPEEHVTHKYYEKEVNYYGMHTFQINGIEAYSYFGEFDGYDYLYLLSINRWMVNELTSMFGDKWIPTFKRWFEKNSGLEVKEINIEGKFLHEH